MENKRTATITWLKYLNFGTYLQAYALQQTIIKLGYENHIIDDTSIPSPQKNVSNMIKSYFLKMLPWDPRSSHRHFSDSTETSNKLYEAFKEKNLIVDATSSKNQSNADSLYDQFICGSDQIWCPTYEEHLNKYYYAGFTKKKTYCVCS